MLRKGKKNHWAVQAILGLFFLMLFAIPLISHADDNYWIIGDGNWTDGLGWSLEYEPAEGDNVLFHKDDGSAITVTYDTLSTPVLTVVSINAINDSSITLYQPQGSLTASQMLIGSDGTGTFIQENGTVTLGESYGTLVLGAQSTGSGTYYLNNGTFTASCEEYIGENGTGYFYQNGGTHILNGAMYVGLENASYGEYNITAGTLTATDHVSIGRNAGSSGYFLLSGTGILDVNELNVGTYGEGIFTQNGVDSINTSNSLYIGRGSGGTGIYEIFAGTHNVNGDMILGENAGSKGSYDLYDGGLTVNGTTIVGNNGSGYFYQAGGVFNANEVWIGVGDNSVDGAYGEYWLESGNLNTAFLIIGGKTGVDKPGYGLFTQEGGVVTVTGNLVLGQSNGSSGFYNLIGGAIITGETHVGAFGAGTFTQTGGTHETNTLVLGYNTEGSGAYNLDSGELSSAVQRIGLEGKGTFSQTVGTNTVTGLLVLGQESTAKGEYYLGGTGSLMVGTSSVNGDLVVGDKGEGYFRQTDSTSDVTVNGALILGGESTSYGQYDMNDGILNAGFIQVARSGSGVFIQYGGLVGVGSGGGINIGQAHGSYGFYDMWGGTLNANSLLIGASGEGTFIQRAGTSVNITEGVVLSGDDTGTGVGTYVMYGGGLSSGNIQVGSWGVGTFNQDYGDITTAGSLTLGVTSTGVGTYNFKDGNLNVGGNIFVGATGTGTFNQAGGINTITGDLIIAGIGGSGTYNFSGGSLSANSITVNKGGLFKGAGTVDTASFQVTGGTVSPGNSPGVLTIAGDYGQDVNSTLLIELGGTEQGVSYDLLSVNGNASLTGTLEVELYDGYTPLAGTYFDILVANIIYGEFSNLVMPSGWTWTVSYLNTDLEDGVDTVRLTANAVPLPSGVWLLIPALAGIVGLRRRLVR